MSKAALSFNLGPIPVSLQPSLLLVLGFLGWISTSASGELWQIGVWIGLGVFSILIHELGHATLLTRYGRTPSIELAGMGGLTRSSGTPLAHARQIAVSVAGPGAGFLLALSAYLLREVLAPGGGTVLAYVLDLAVWINVAWSLFNLVPIYPLDGGHVMQSSFAFVDSPWARRAPHIISIIVGAIVVMVGLSYGQIFVVLIIGSMVMENFRALTQVKTIESQQQVRNASVAYRSGNKAEGISALDNVIDGRASSGAVKAQAVLLRAWASIEEGDNATAVALVEKHRSTAPLGLVEASTTWATGSRSAAVARFVQALASEPIEPPAWLPDRLGWTDGEADQLTAWAAELDPPGRDQALRSLQDLFLRSGRFGAAGRLAEHVWRTVDPPPAIVAMGAARAALRQGQRGVAQQWIAAGTQLGLPSDLVSNDTELRTLV